MNNIKIILAVLVWFSTVFMISMLLIIIGKIELIEGAPLWIFYTSYIAGSLAISIFKLIRTVEEL